MQTLFNWIELMENGLGQLVIRFRYAIIIASLVVVTIMAIGASQGQLSTGWRPLFNENDHRVIAFDAMEAEYTKANVITYIIQSKKGEIFSPDVLDAVIELTEKSWGLPFATKVDSLSNFQFTKADGDDLFVGDLVSNPQTYSPSDLEEIKANALNEPALLGQIISENGEVTAINISFDWPLEFSQPPIEVQITNASRELAKEFEAKFSQLNIQLTGNVMIDAGFMEVAIQDGKSIMPLSIALMLIIFLVLTRSISATILTMVVIFCSIIIAVGTLTFCGVKFHTVSATAPTIILTIASASCVHLLITFLNIYRVTGQPHNAITETVRLNVQPITLTSLSTAIGFLTILLSDTPAFRVLAILVTIGILASWLMVLFLLPALLSFLPIKKDKETNRSVGNVSTLFMEKLGLFIAKHYRALFIGMLVCITVAVLGIPKNTLNDNFVHYFGKELDFRQASDFAEQNLAGVVTVQYSLDSRVMGGINNPKFLNELENFGLWLKQQPEVLDISTITDTYKRLNKSMHGDDPAAYQLPTSQEEAAQYLLLYEMSLPYGMELTNQINLDKSKTRLIINLVSLNSQEFVAFDQRAVRWLNENTTMSGTSGTGPLLLFTYKSLSNAKEMILTASLALFGISVLLILMLRSIRLGAISLVPNLIPAAIGFGIWGFIDGEINLILALVMTMTLGIVVDDTVHFLSKYQRARRELGKNSKEAVIYSFKTVGQSLFITSTMLAGGFFILMQSNFLLNSSMGLLTGIIIIAALIADFFFLPPLLIMLDGKKDN